MKKTTMPVRAPQPIIPPVMQAQPKPMPSTPRPTKAAVAVKISTPMKPTPGMATPVTQGKVSNAGAPPKPMTPKQFKAGRMRGPNGIK